VSLHYLVKCQTTHLKWWRHWSMLIKSGMWPPNSPDLNPISYAVWDVLNRWSVNVDDSRQLTSWSKWSSLSGANCRRVWLIAPLVVILDVSSSSKADTLNIWCKIVRHDFLDNNWDNKVVVSVVILLIFIVAEVVLFSIVTLKTLTFHKVV